MGEICALARGHKKASVHVANCVDELFGRDETPLRDRKDGVCISDFESALIGRILVCRAKGRFITSEELVDAVRDVD